MSIAVFVGRLQPLHKGHESIINKALSENEKLIIVLGSANESRTKMNPFTFNERERMIKSCIKGNYEIISLDDVHNNELWMNNLEKAVGKFDSVYTGNPLTKELFSKRGYLVRNADFKFNVSGTKVRELISKDEKSWRDLVPNGCLKILDGINAVKIIKQGINREIY